MKKTLLILLLALGMCSINVSAQTRKPVRKATTQVRKASSSTKPAPKNSREYKVEDDGFEWYLVCNNGKYGAESKDGKVIIVSEYDRILLRPYIHTKEINYEGGFEAKKGAYSSFFNYSGRCLIPYTKKYKSIEKRTEPSLGTYYICKDTNGYTTLLNSNCEEVNTINYPSFGINYENGKFYYSLQENNLNGIADADNNLIVPIRYKEYILLSKEGEFYITNEETNERKVVGYISSITSNRNPLAGNPKENSTSITSSTTSSSTSNNNNNNSGGGTTKVVVEHQHTPQPVQQWQACFACGGMGKMGCDNCGGSGTKYIGDRLHRCSRCNGRGEIPCNTCYGNKGQYITVYR